MNNKYQIPKNSRPESKSDILYAQIEDLIKKRDAETDEGKKQALHQQIIRLFAQYERAKL